jgi:deazaflavin-dependent oxidoreductase (nitroreductase family)
MMWTLHKAAYKITGGKVGGRMNSMPVLLMTTTGRKSGEPREVALTYVPAGRNMAVIGSNVGEDRDPAWVLNLRANPVAGVRVKKEAMKVVAREAEGDERARLWAEAVEKDPSYSVYEKRTKRPIPVIVLEPT